MRVAPSTMNSVLLSQTLKVQSDHAQAPDPAELGTEEPEPVRAGRCGGVLDSASRAILRRRSTWCPKAQTAQSVVDTSYGAVFGHHRSRRDREGGDHRRHQRLDPDHGRAQDPGRGLAARHRRSAQHGRGWHLCVRWRRSGDAAGRPHRSRLRSLGRSDGRRHRLLPGRRCGRDHHGRRRQPGSTTASAPTPTGSSPPCARSPCWPT